MDNQKDNIYNDDNGISDYPPKISIIIPAYNIEDYIGECLESVVNQTYKNLEIIVIDDGSTDSTPQIIDKYASQDDRIIALHNKNGGVSSARNAGLDIMTGEYVSFIDGDDLVDDDLYSSIIPLFYKYKKTDLIQFGFNHYYGYLDDYVKDRDLKLNFIEGYNSLYEYANGNIFGCTLWNKIYKRELLDDIRFYVGKYYEDGPFILEAFFKIHNSIQIDNSFYHYRKDRLGSITNKLSNKIFDEWEIIDNIKVKYKKNEHIINCINNYSIERSFYNLVHILNIKDAEKRKEMIKKVLNYSKKLRSTKLLCPFGIKYIKYKIFLWIPHLFCIIKRLIILLKTK